MEEQVKVGELSPGDVIVFGVAMPSGGVKQFRHIVTLVSRMASGSVAVEGLTMATWPDGETSKPDDTTLYFVDDDMLVRRLPGASGD